MSEPKKPENPITKYYQQEPDLRFAVISAEQERDLFTRARAGDDEARTFLIENHLLFTAQQARVRSKGKLPDDEVISAGNMALMNAIDRFDPNRGARFTTYLRYFINAAVSKLWQQHDPVDYKKHFPTGDENEPAFREPLEETSETPDFAGDEMKSLMLGALADARAKLPEEDQVLLKRVFDEGLTRADVARLEGVSREAIRTRLNRVLTRLRFACKAVRNLG